MKQFTILVVLLFLSSSSFAQKKRDYVDYWAHYYPFKDGVQMVKVVFGITDLSLLVKNTGAQPDCNTPLYIFRNKEGKILKSFNTCGYKPKHFKLLSPSENIPDNMQTEHLVNYYPLFSKCKRKPGFLYEDADMSKSQWGLFDRKGNIIIPAKYDETNIVDDTIVVAQKDGKFGILDLRGAIIQPFEHDGRIQYYANDYPAVGRKNGRHFYIDRLGKIISKEYDFAEMFWSRRGRIRNKGKWGFVDSTGAEIVSPIYDEAEAFYYYTAIVGKKGKYGVIDNQGNIVQPIQYDKIDPVRGEHGVAIIAYRAYKGKKVTVLKRDGLQDIPENDLETRISKLPLEDIPQPCEMNFCSSPNLVKEIQVNGNGPKLVVIHRTCTGNTSRHGGTFDITESSVINQYEVWNLKKKKLLFKAVNHYRFNYNRFNVYASPSSTKGTVGYQYLFEIDDQGQITISNIISRQNQEQKKDEDGNDILSSNTPSPIHPDHKEGVYVFRFGKFIKE